MSEPQRKERGRRKNYGSVASPSEVDRTGSRKRVATGGPECLDRPKTLKTARGGMARHQGLNHGSVGLHLHVKVVERWTSLGLRTSAPTPKITFMSCFCSTITSVRLFLAKISTSTDENRCPHQSIHLKPMDMFLFQRQLCYVYSWQKSSL